MESTVKSKVGVNGRVKGADAEREFIRLLQPVVNKVQYREGLGSVEPYLTGPILHRNLDQTRVGGHDICGLDWLAIEVKRCETLEIDKWWEQTLRQAEEADGATPVLAYRQSRKPWNVVMWVSPMHHWFDEELGLVRGTIGLGDFLLWLECQLKGKLLSESLTKPMGAKMCGLM